LVSIGNLFCQDIQLEFIAIDTISGDSLFEGTKVGGLSGIEYNPVDESYWAIVDQDPKFPQRFYQLDINYGDEFRAIVKKVTTIKSRSGKVLKPGKYDPEALRYRSSSNTLIWTEEGVGNKRPHIFEMDLDGKIIQSFKLPPKYLPSSKKLGVRRNMSFESLCFSDDRQTVFIAAEHMLAQDLDCIDILESGRLPLRIMQYNLETEKVINEYVYPFSAREEGFNGVVEILALDNSSLLVVERFFHRSHKLKLYLADITMATDVSEYKSLCALAPGSFHPVKSKLIFDFDKLLDDGSIDHIENVEGVTFGPVTGKGERTLIFISDDNFETYEPQATQVLFFKIIE
jgi:hypothetical protein